VETVYVDLGGGRQLCVDDTGDAGGAPVVFVHGTPDSRRARHPDDTIAAALGVRLLAVDRPGFGGSTADPAATPGSFGRALGVLLDELGVASCSLLAWSAGSLWALGAASELPDRVTTVGVAAGLVPREAYLDPIVWSAAPEARRALVDTADELGVTEAAELIAPLLVPDPATLDAALEQLHDSHDPATRADLDAVPGAVPLMARSMLDAVQHGTAGLVRDVEVQVTPGLVDLEALRCPVQLWYGTADVSTPPAFGEWFAARLPDATLHTVAGGSHALLLPRWREILAALVR
jgi:pimeloyl-ACP methyl ester carboxylesterase